MRDDIGNRMKEYYENIPKTKLMRKMPVIIRLDGRAFHTFTKGFNRPFDAIFALSMQQTMKSLCENCTGCVLGYTQSDEITLILIDYQTHNTAAWFNYEVQKLCSVTASMATLFFNRCFQDYAAIGGIGEELKEAYERAIWTGATFDSRCFNIPKEEVTNCLYWRQLDASRNSVQMLARSYFSHKELLRKSNSEILDMLVLEKGVNWNDLPVWQKRGSCCIRDEDRWIIDRNIPIFVGEGREYIEQEIRY